MMNAFRETYWQEDRKIGIYKNLLRTKIIKINKMEQQNNIL